MDSDVQGTWLYCKYVGKQMIEQGKGGKVIMVSSAISKIGMATWLMTALLEILIL